MFSANSSQVSNGATYIEDVFSTYLTTGNGASYQTVTNGIDLSGKGGLVWTKGRSNPEQHRWEDTARGAANELNSASTAAQDAGGVIGQFNNNGFTVFGNTNYTYAHWTFRKQPKFFDVVTYTGNGSNRTISHNLGSVPGCIIVKRTDTAGNWQVYHNSLTSAAYSIQLNLTNAQASATTVWNSTAPTSTVFSLGTSADVNASGGTYVAYIFAHNAGGFGSAGTDNVISCGSFTTDASGVATVSLGYEPQWLLTKATAGTESWNIQDVMRGFTASGGATLLSPNQSTSEANYLAYNIVAPQATGFKTGGDGYAPNTSYIYIAIRRGPMKTPTSGTSVFSPVAWTGTGATATSTVGFAPDAVISHSRNNTFGGDIADKLRGVNRDLIPNNTSAETDDSGNSLFYTVSAFLNTGYQVGQDQNLASVNYSGNYAHWVFQRAPGFFDEVCYTGTGTTNNVLTHNLGVAPELVITKSRSFSPTNWPTATRFTSTGGRSLNLNTTGGDGGGEVAYGTGWMIGAQPTATTLTLGGTANAYNGSGQTYVTYLFATCPGVSKVGSYSGTGATQTISCGFTGGARFVLIKRTDTTGDWYVWDSARGMVAGTDPSLLLNTTAAEVNANSIYTTTGGFQIVSTAAGINASGGTYIYLAIA